MIVERDEAVGLRIISRQRAPRDGMRDHGVSSKRSRRTCVNIHQIAVLQAEILEILCIGEDHIPSAGHAAVAVVQAIDRRIILVVARSEEHTSELQSLMRISYAVFCLKKKKITKHDEQLTV